jgi:hypothetical protein
MIGNESTLVTSWFLVSLSGGRVIFESQVYFQT